MSTLLRIGVIMATYAITAPALWKLFGAVGMLPEWRRGIILGVWPLTLLVIVVVVLDWWESYGASRRPPDGLPQARTRRRRCR